MESRKLNPKPYQNLKMDKNLMKKCEKSIEKYKNRVKKPQPWILIHGKKSCQKS